MFGLLQSRFALPILFLLLWDLWGCTTFAQNEANQQQSFMAHFHSQAIEFPGENSPFAKDSPGRYPAALKFLFQKVLSWNPDGVRGSYSAECDPALWQSRLNTSKVKSAVLQSALIRRYLSECGAQLESGHSSGISNFLKIMTLRFSNQDHPFLHRVVFHLPNDIKLKGYLALKGDIKKRPMVILRLGIFSSAEDFLPERFLLMQLFEQSPFNVLVLENMTGPDFIANNKDFAFGGYDEGIQNIQVAEMLQNPKQPLSEIIDSVHLTGMSLGGHGVLFASLLNETAPKAQIQSFLALCPVVNLRETVENLDNRGYESRAINYWSSKRLEGLREKIPALQNVSRFHILSNMMKAVVDRYPGGLSWTPETVLPKEMTDSREFWKQNDFWSFYKNVRTPVMVWATEQDPLVTFSKNAGTLHQENIGVVPFKQGFHCTLPVAYHWDVISTLLQAYVLSHAPNFHLQEEKMQIDISEEKLAAADGPVHFDVGWVEDKEKFVRLEMHGFQLSLPLSSFDFTFLNPTLTVAEQRMLERWLQQNLSVNLKTETDGKKTLKISWKKAA
jgi:predicted alpha/beta-fold hydrolase